MSAAYKPCPSCGQRGVFSEPLTFGELKPFELFIAFPRDGDDSEHGGFRGAQRIFQKTNTNTHDPTANNAVAAHMPHTHSHMPEGTGRSRI